MVKIVKNPGSGRLNNLNDPVLNVLSVCILYLLLNHLHTRHIKVKCSVTVGFNYYSS